MGQVLEHVGRILKKGGVVASVSYEDPVRRVPILKGEMHEQPFPFAKVTHSVFDEDQYYHFYTAVRAGRGVGM